MGLFIISSIAAGVCCGAGLLTTFWNKCRRNAACLTEFQKSKLEREFKLFFATTQTKFWLVAPCLTLFLFRIVTSETAFMCDVRQLFDRGQALSPLITQSFVDLDGDGVINWTDFELARNCSHEKLMACYYKQVLELYLSKLSATFYYIIQLTSEINCWRPESQKYLACENVYKNIWDSLKSYADKNNDEKVTLEEWFAMWENLTVEMQKQDDLATTPEEKFPLWLYQYLLLRFNVLDRAGDGSIDSEEYEYAMSKYGVKARDSRRSFLLFSENNTKKIDFETFCSLCADYYFSNDPAVTGNFISAKLDFF